MLLIVHWDDSGNSSKSCISEELRLRRWLNMQYLPHRARNYLQTQNPHKSAGCGNKKKISHEKIAKKITSQEAYNPMGKYQTEKRPFKIRQKSLVLWFTPLKIELKGPRRAYEFKTAWSTQYVLDYKCYTVRQCFRKKMITYRVFLRNCSWDFPLIYKHTLTEGRKKKQGKEK